MYNLSVSQKLSEELVQMILQTEDLIYPGYPVEPETEVDWTDINETVSFFDDLPEDELNCQAEQFYSHLHQHWEVIDQNVQD
ncbi:hypothetical protein [Chroococcus sp. FPU101]|uniref:hypothetical protein n=1 Tax=Chroococcus sp. FPU101 TaxID=1974212 RepID=UPI001A8E1B2B|nr:hypothetical protein [Chroococcus sp. FPU101]GFE69977.1 hypothetical protein CFPU101_25870 [Chroococcus sp. FPU101]